MELEVVLQNKCMSKGVQTLCLNTFFSFSYCKRKII